MWVVVTILGGTDRHFARSASYDELLRLGYPPHFSTLLGVWKVLGAVALVVPGYPLVKEWAYAGFLIDFSGAMVAYTSVGDGVVS